MDQLKEKIKKAILKSLETKEISNIDIELEIPKNNDFGDFSTNIALKLSKALSKNPSEIANEIIESLPEIEEVDKVEAVHPGFINFYLKNDSYFQVVKEVLEQKDKYGVSDFGNGKDILIEFGQPNTHKAFHVGHLKSAISGLSMVKLHENLGYKVIKANYFGDIGMHVAKATWGFIKKGEPENFDTLDKHSKMKYIDECYVYGSKEFKENPQSEKEIREVNSKIYKEIKDEEYQIYLKLRKASLEHQNDIWQSLGIKFDREYPESEVFKDAINIVEENKDKVFTQSEGALIYDGTKEKLTTWVFLTKDGNPTYSAKDLALAKKKFQEFPNIFKAIVTTSIEQLAYFKVVIRVLEIIAPETKGRYFHIPFGWMLREDKKKFSSRMGETIKGMDIIEETKRIARSKVSELKQYSEDEIEEISHNVAISGLKFMILSHEFHKDFSYEPEKFLSFEGYSGPYILYTYSRAKSILRKSEVEIKEIDIQNLELKEKSELQILKILSKYPEIAMQSGKEITPHSICNYLYELSSAFNSFYTNLSVLNAENKGLKNSRIALTASVAQVLKNGLNLLGIETVEKM